MKGIRQQIPDSPSLQQGAPEPICRLTFIIQNQPHFPHKMTKLFPSRLQPNCTPLSQFSYHHKCDLLRFSKTRELWNLKAAFTTAVFAALNHNYDNRERTLKNRKRLEIQQSQTITFWTCWSKLLLPKRSIKMIDGSQERKRQVGFELHNLRVFERRS